MSKTRIEWADSVWNPVSGCSKVSAGCENCYAERMAKRLAGRCGYPAEEPFGVTLHHDRIDQPLNWKKPRRIFVCSMGDLFHSLVPYSFIASVFSFMSAARQHHFMILTKRPDRMADFIAWYKREWLKGHEDIWPREFSHVWLGVTAEDQQAADERIPILLQMPAAQRFVSVEPMLGPVDLKPYLGITGIDWTVCGGESGPGARPMHPDWARSLRDQCQQAKVPFLFKQWGMYCYPDQMSDEEYRAWDVQYGTGDYHNRPFNLGKKRAGRLLDGRTWDEFPGGTK